MRSMQRAHVALLSPSTPGRSSSRGRYKRSSTPPGFPSMSYVGCCNHGKGDAMRGILVVTSEGPRGPAYIAFPVSRSPPRSRPRRRMRLSWTMMPPAGLSASNSSRSGRRCSRLWLMLLANTISTLAPCSRVRSRCRRRRRERCQRPEVVRSARYYKTRADRVGRLRRERWPRRDRVDCRQPAVRRRRRVRLRSGDGVPSVATRRPGARGVIQRTTQLSRAPPEKNSPRFSRADFSRR